MLSGVKQKLGGSVAEQDREWLYQALFNKAFGCSTFQSLSYANEHRRLGTPLWESLLEGELGNPAQPQALWGQGITFPRT